LVGYIPGREGVGDFYYDDNDEDDDKDNDHNDDDDNEEDQCPCLYPEVLPTQSTMTMMTSFHDATTNLMVRCIPGRGEGGG